MPLWGYSLVVCGVIAVALISKQRSTNKGATRIADKSEFGPQPLATFKGHERWLDPQEGTVESPYYSTLEIYDGGIRIHQSSTFPFPKGLSPTWEAKYSEIDDVRAVQTASKFPHRVGVRIGAHLPGAPLVFWSNQYLEIMEIFDRMGVKADLTMRTLSGPDIG